MKNPAQQDCMRFPPTLAANGNVRLLVNKSTVALIVVVVIEVNWSSLKYAQGDQVERAGARRPSTVLARVQ